MINSAKPERLKEKQTYLYCQCFANIGSFFWDLLQSCSFFIYGHTCVNKKIGFLGGIEKINSLSIAIFIYFFSSM